MSAAISVSGLVKTFGPTRALDGLDLEVSTGEVHGFLGPNGSGKSTTLRVLLGLLRTDSGDVRLLGGDPWRDAVALHRRLAYVPGEVTLWPQISGGEAIDLLGRLRGGIDPARKAELLDRFDLAVTVAIVGLAPRAAAGVAWGLVAYVVVVTMFAQALEWPGWVDDLSPMSWTPLVPIESWTTAAAVGLGGVVVVLLAVGFGSFRRRDLTTS